MAHEPGIDPTPCDLRCIPGLFSEGSFIGKGIYDVDAFEQSSATVSGDRILSHDLLEGSLPVAGY